MSNKTGFIRFLGSVILLLIIGISFGYYQITPTKAPKDYKDDIITLQDIPDEDADFRMVMSHVYQMAKEPHPAGSKENADVQAYLMKQFELIGCSYETQPFTVNMKAEIDQQVNSYHEYMKEHPEEKKAFEEFLEEEGYSSYEEKYRADIGCTQSDELNLINYIIKLDAPNTDRGVIFVSHYDSTRGGPGAADDIISVASMLEALREVHSKAEYTNDLYFLFTDGEERNLLGADAFVKANPGLNKSIDLVVNLEARGNAGTLIMFQTSLNNKNIVKVLNKALKDNTMFSMTSAVYKVMPNDTDLTKFLEADYPGINFAVVDNPETYHMPTDNYVNLDRNSAYMYYRTTVELANHFSNADLNSLTSWEDAVYFPFFKGNTIVLSNNMIFLFSCFLGAVSLIWIIYMIIRRDFHIKDLLITLVYLLLTLLGTAIIGYGGSHIYTAVLQSGDWYELADILDVIFYVLCLFAALITTISIWHRTIKVKNRQIILTSCIFLYNILNWICTMVFNSLAYIFTVPLCFLLLYSLILFVTRDKVKLTMSHVFVILQGIILCILYVPCIYLLYTALLANILTIATLMVGLCLIPMACLSAVTFVKIKDLE